MCNMFTEKKKEKKIFALLAVVAFYHKLKTGGVKFQVDGKFKIIAQKSYLQPKYACRTSLQSPPRMHLHFH